MARFLAVVRSAASGLASAAAKCLCRLCSAAAAAANRAETYKRAKGKRSIALIDFSVSPASASRMGAGKRAAAAAAGAVSPFKGREVQANWSRKLIF